MTAKGAGVKPFPSFSWIFLVEFLSTKQMTRTAMPTPTSIASCHTGE
jgi:hypothetical protein